MFLTNLNVQMTQIKLIKKYTVLKKIRILRKDCAWTFNAFLTIFWNSYLKCWKIKIFNYHSSRNSYSKGLKIVQFLLAKVFIQHRNNVITLIRFTRTISIWGWDTSNITTIFVREGDFRPYNPTALSLPRGGCLWCTQLRDYGQRTSAL